MGGPAKLCEALMWWDQGQLCCALPPADEAALRSHLCGLPAVHQDALAQCGVTALATRGPWASSCRSVWGGKCQELEHGT